MPTHNRIAIVGSGFAGLGAAIKLMRAGFDDLVILERGDDVGGTWRDNTYPGCACDVESLLYSFSFAPNPHWTRKFAPQSEIWTYLQSCVEKYRLGPYLRFNCPLLGARWNDAEQHWELETGDGPRTADILITGTGPLSEPKVPDLPGLANFSGTMFHSARWDHDHDLTGRRVAIVGSGASAVQFLPHVQKRAEHIVSFQRNAPWIVPRRDEPIGPRERRLFRIFPAAQRVARLRIYLLREMLVRGLLGNQKMADMGQQVALKHLIRRIPDLDLRAKLTPKYRFGCKRILLSDDYYPAVRQPNVDVVTDGIADIRADRIIDGAGVVHEVDTLILATGFHVTDMPIAGLLHDAAGRSLAEHWQGSPQTYLGTTVTGFPNLFMLVGPNTGLGHSSIILMIEAQLAYLLDCLRRMDRRGLSSVEVRPEAQRAFNVDVQRKMRTTAWTTGGCDSWYLDPYGRNTTLWPDTTWRFRLATRSFDPHAYVERGVTREPVG
ncbi:MAG TPA: NAD(P)/FAD-dependent oxidoreductase [Mycobacteriales bacterium]|jgi:cation diffusion facilitator CzcD-associated flavoprotein CzcO|nr:NAD(P)/FAD-dependent oxidoreductase [Mycobacteriales bacterium]